MSFYLKKLSSVFIAIEKKAANLNKWAALKL